MTLKFFLTFIGVVVAILMLIKLLDWLSHNRRRPGGRASASASNSSGGDVSESVGGQRPLADKHDSAGDSHSDSGGSDGGGGGD